MLRRALLSLVAFLPLALARPVLAADAPSEIKIGHLHAGSGPYASISMPVYLGLKLWVDQTNASGGAFVKAFNKKIPLKLISYDDQSSTRRRRRCTTSSSRRTRWTCWSPIPARC